MNSRYNIHLTRIQPLFAYMQSPDIQDMWDVRRASSPAPEWEDDNAQQGNKKWEYVGIVSEEVDAFFQKRFGPSLIHRQRF